MRIIPFSIIEAAKKSDREAVEFILRHFEGYIISRCLTTYVDQYGNTKTFLDDELRYQAENAVLAAIFSFQFRDPPADYSV